MALNELEGDNAEWINLAQNWDDWKARFENSNEASDSIKNGKYLSSSQKRFCSRSYCNYLRNPTAPALSFAHPSNWIQTK
jgi:hypothetical protein